MIETTLGACAAAVPAFERLAARDLPVKTAYVLAKLIGGVQAEAAIFERERAKLVQKHGIQRDATDAERAQYGPRVTTVRPDAIDAFTVELMDLSGLAVQIAFPAFNLGLLNGADISARDLLLLGSFVQFTEG
jgi:hypothetical protein